MENSPYLHIFGAPSGRNENSERRGQYPTCCFAFDRSGSAPSRSRVVYGTHIPYFSLGWFLFHTDFLTYSAKHEKSSAAEIKPEKYTDMTLLKVNAQGKKGSRAFRTYP